MRNKHVIPLPVTVKTDRRIELITASAEDPVSKFLYASNENKCPSPVKLS
ncbi:MAG: hypothetical protein IPP52_11535 [Ignavibacteria bacterium]|nr:hypothetical protein [Ignavibacteria bacterium]